MRFIHFSGLLALITILLFNSCSKDESFNGSLYYSPQSAIPGTEITVKYNPDSSNFAGKEDVKLIAYFYGNSLNKTIDVPLKKEREVYTGKFTTEENTLGVLLKFVSGNEIDNNDKQGYIIFLKDSEGNNLAGSLAGFGAALNRWGAYYLDLDRDRERAHKFMIKDFNTHPEIKPLFLNSYFEMVSKVKPETKNQIILAVLMELENSNPTGEDELSILAHWYKKIGNEEKADLFKSLVLEKHPQCEIAEDQKIAEFRSENSSDKKIEILKEFEQQFPTGKKLEYLYDLTANVYRDNKQYEEVLQFLKNNVSKPSTYRFYSVVSRMLDEKSDLNIALSISELGVERCRQELKNPSNEKPDYLSESEWLKDREYYLGLNLYGKGRVLYALDKRKEAQLVLQESVQLTKNEDELINELYAKSLIENGEYHKAMSEISVFIKSGYSTAQMRSFLKEAYLNEKGTDDGFETYASQFENAAKEKLIARLKNEMILEPAPQFSLLDLDGNKVSLQDYKGKTIIIDFWATWCGPCLSSFPGMKQAVQKYADNENVKFLFVNSWERVEDIRTNAVEFIAKNDYPFRVLLDDENIVIGKYMVSGIPTKFVIDSEGNIRFKSIGFSGSDNKLVEEISTMISLVN